MLFNSPFFILFFLPIVLLVYWALRQSGYTRGAVNALILASFFFYGWWDYHYLALIIGGILFNYGVCRQILSHRSQQKTGKLWLMLGIGVDLGLLGYFKYTDFLITNVNHLLGTQYPLMHIILPLGISFFIFQKIAFLVDAYRGEFDQISLRQFTAFVIFFPQLIAGPIPRHNELFVQFEDHRIPTFDWENMVLGMMAFGIGLFKKTVIADGLALWGSPYFKVVATGYNPTFIESWSSVLSYTFQIYFDFSGYSDMAIGLALLFGYQLPVNFFSPYKATNIIDFWRRWHMTLSRFLRDYLYIALGGNRKGYVRQKINLFLTMLIGGLWHGASWNFVIWGAMHGLYLSINHLWIEFKKKIGFSKSPTFLSIYFSRILTFLAIMLSWVFFRADNVHDALKIIETLFGFHGLTLNESHVLALGRFGQWLGVIPHRSEFFWGLPQVITLIGLLFIVWVMPNTYEYLNNTRVAILTYKEHTEHMFTHPWLKKLIWKPSLFHLIAGLCFIGTGSWYAIRGGEFLYFQF